jgi:methyltransferase (TIGR00027 family)
MKPSQSSTTALGIAATRAIESEKPAGERICDDAYARRFLNPLFYQIMRFFVLTGYAERSGPGVMGYLAARCRHIDEFLLKMTGEGLEQLVILGAGFDSRAYRYANRLEHVKVFEVDHPATQAAKLDKLCHIFGQAPAHVTYLGVDFNTQALDRRLFEYGYDQRRKTLFV